MVGAAILSTGCDPVGCSSDGDCPADSICNQTLEICLPSHDAPPPPPSPPPKIGSLRVNWTVDGAPARTGCANGDVATVAISFTDDPATLNAPCLDGQAVVPVVSIGVHHVVVTPHHGDGHCFNSGGGNCTNVTQAVTVDATTTATISVALVATAQVTVSWTLDGLVPDTRICRTLDTATVHVALTPGTGPAITLDVPCENGGAGFVNVPTFESYAVHADVVRPGGGIPTSLVSAPFYLDPGQSFTVPTLGFVFDQGRIGALHVTWTVNGVAPTPSSPGACTAIDAEHVELSYPADDQEPRCDEGQATLTAVATGTYVLISILRDGNNGALDSSSTEFTVTPNATTELALAFTSNVPGIAISPKPASTTTLGALTFSALVFGLPNTAVTWSVDESVTDFTGGRISAAGVYTAPAMPGTYHVRASSQADPAKFDVSAVTVAVGCMEALPVLSPVVSPREFLNVGKVPVKVDSLGRPVVAWIEYAPYVAYVARYESGAWTLLGSAGLPLGGTGGPAFVDLAIDSHDRPVAAYEVRNTTSGVNEIHVAVWNGVSAWTELPLPVPQGTSNNGFALTLDTGDQPVLALARNLPSRPLRDIEAARWTGTGWSLVTGIYKTALDLVSLPDVVVDSAGDITVAWTEDVAGVNKPFAYKVSGPGTGLLPTPDTGITDRLQGPVLAFDSSGKLNMAWSNWPDPNPNGISDGLEVSTYDGPGWTQRGTSLPGVSEVVVPEHNFGNNSSPHRLVKDLDTGQLAAATIATANAFAAVYEYDGRSSWPMVCAPVPDAEQSDDVAINLDATGLAYDPVHHVWVIAAASANMAAKYRLFVARVHL
jgi:hypothetical protein